MTEAAPVMIWQSDPDKVTTYVNQAWCDFTGRTSEQADGTGWAHAVHSADVERYLASYAAAFNARQDFELEYRLRRHDGEYRLVFDRGIQLRGDDDTFIGYVRGCVDITDHKDLLGQQREVLLDALRTRIGEELRDHASQTSFVTALMTSAALGKLGRLVRCFQQRTGIDADLVMTGRRGPLEAPVAETLHAAAEEALATVERRAQASAVLLGLRVTARSVTLCVQDDAGFLARARLPLKGGGAVTWLREGSTPPTACQ
jgi:PAS domain S-box-containing protein